MTFASDPGTEARACENMGREAALEVFELRDGSIQSKMKYFIDGFNEIAQRHGGLSIQLMERPKAPARLPFWQRRWARKWLHRLGLRKEPF